VRAAIVLGDHVDVVMIPPPVRLLVLDPDVGKMNLVVEVRQVVLEGPLPDLLVGPIRVAVVVRTVSVALVQPLLVPTLELVVENDPLDASAWRS
jgi:hypothetical protein